MKLYRYLLAALIYALPTAAFAQCSGIQPAGSVCGNPSGVGAIAAPTRTPVLGLPGTAEGTLSFGNATSGTIKLQPATGALGTSVLTLPATTGTLATTTSPAPSIVVGTTTVTSGTSVGVLFNNAGVLGNTAAGTSGFALIGNGASAPTFKGYVPPITGGVTRPWQDKAADILNAADTGVVCDGSDETTKLNSAIAAAAATNKQLILPGGFCGHTSLTLPQTLNMRGQGREQTTLYQLSNSAESIVISTANSNVQLSDFRIVPSGTRTAASNTIHISSSATLYLRRIDLVSQGVAVRTDSTGVTLDVDDALLTTTVFNGIDFDFNGCFICSIRNTVSSASSGARPFAHIAMRSVEGQISLFNNNAFQHQHGIIALPGTGQVVTLVKSSLVYLDSMLVAGIAISPTGTGIVDNFDFDLGWLSSHGAPFALTAGGSTTANAIKVRNSRIVPSSGSATRGLTATGGTFIDFSGNTLSQFTDSAIVFDGVTSCSADRNIQASSSGAGISLLNTTDYCKIESGNQLQGAATPVVNTASGTHNFVAPPLAVLLGANGGTGVANTSKTITIGGNVLTAGAFTISGSFGTTLTVTGTTGVTLPTSGTLATLAGSEAFTNKTYNGLTINTTTGTLAVTNGKTASFAASTTFGGADGKTLTVGNTLSFTGTDGSSVAFGAGGTVLYNGGALGTPSSVTLTNGTGLPISTGVSGLGTGVATALAINIGSAGAPVTFNGALGTPSSGTLTNATGLPVSTGISGLGTGIATALAVNVGTAGAPVVNGGALGSPSSVGTVPAFTLGGTVSGGGNQINNVIIGTSTPLAGSFTALSASTSTALTGTVTASFTTSAGSGNPIGVSGSLSRTTTSGTTDSTIGLQYAATDSGTTSPTTFVGFKIVPTLSNSNNTSAANFGLSIAAQVTANATSLNGIEAGLTVFSGTLATWRAFHAAGTSGTITNKYSFLGDSGAGRADVADGFAVAGSNGLSATKAVRASGGLADCTLIFTGGILTGGSC